jgi:hypothetical protein
MPRSLDDRRKARAMPFLKTLAGEGFLSAYQCELLGISVDGTAPWENITPRGEVI